MVFACGISNYSVSVFHLLNHAKIKALLFLSAGSVIHALSDEQDMRKMGGVVQLLPFFTFFCFFRRKRKYKKCTCFLYFIISVL